MHSPYGPHKIATNGQVVLPKDVLAASGLSPGDSVYLQALDSADGAILIVPAKAATEWFDRGRRQALPIAPTDGRFTDDADAT